ncbi:MAG: aminotransferase class IV [Spirochaetota bacterium]
MSLLIESLCCVDGIIQNIKYHNERMNKSRYDLFGCNDTLCIENFVSLPDYAYTGIWKVRVHYDSAIHHIEYELYKKKSIKTLKIVIDDSIDYSYKYSDRSRIAYLFEKRGNADDILILKNGLVTDSSTANVAFYNGKQWVTPATPLLPGTKRACLIDEGLISQRYIRLNDIGMFTHVSLINAFLDIGDIVVPITSIEM